eukprot:1888788-Amphidinium_carterae.1
MASDRPTSSMTFVPSLRGQDDTQDAFVLRLPPQRDEALNAFVRSSQFHAGSSYVFKTDAHINRQEMLAWLSGLRFFIRHHTSRRRK